MSVRSIILELVKEKGEVQATEIMAKTGYSRSYVIRYLLQLRDEGYIALLGKANQARYVRAGSFETEKAKVLSYHRMFDNEGLSEDFVMDDIRKNTGILNSINDNIRQVFGYGFLEITNNAIEHSSSAKVSVLATRDEQMIRFEIADSGIGIYENIRSKKGFHSDAAAIEALLNGRITTSEKSHSGEGIFFTSKVADTFIIESGTKKIVFNNIEHNVNIKTIKPRKGTKVRFSLNLASERNLEAMFREYSNDAIQYDKTEALVRLNRIGNELLSRSIARRVLAGLDRLAIVKLDFERVDTIGQAFADEVFRVWKTNHPDITIVPANENENVRFMIEHVQKASVR
jgi:anti-sigma regulatory factor (Ser/Thr protein kinase)